jgi:hypothetical protein
MRYEPAFRTRYVAPLGLPPTEEIARSISWGLMQVMGQVAREHGFSGKYLSALCDPAAGLELGCTVLASKIALARRHDDNATPGERSTSANCMSVCRAATLGCVTIGSRTSGGVTPVRNPGSNLVPTEAQYRRALEMWNGGANVDYAEQVLERVQRYS